MKICLPSKKFLIGMFSVLIVIAVLLAVVPAAYAEDTGPLTPIQGLGRPSNASLIRMHKLEGGWFNDQESLIKEANQLSVTFQALIDSLASEGKDVSSLVDALATFDSEVAASTEIHGRAGEIIYSLVGWKGTGDVKDRQAAGQSLLDGRAALSDANFRLNNAMPALEKSFVLWRANRINRSNNNESTAEPTQSCTDSDVIPCVVY